MPNPVPEGFRTLTPYIVVKDTARAIDFYKRAFGAEEVFRMAGPDGKSVVHAEIRIGDSMVMLSDESPHSIVRAPESVGATTGGIMVYVGNVDELFKRAVQAGAQAKQPPSDMFWGDRMANLVDPFGHCWSVATHIEDVAPEEIRRRAKEFYEKMRTQAAGQ